MNSRSLYRFREADISLLIRFDKRIGDLARLENRDIRRCVVVSKRSLPGLTLWPVCVNHAFGGDTERPVCNQGAASEIDAELLNSLAI
jgi:hypothetical protein